MLGVVLKSYEHLGHKRVSHICVCCGDTFFTFQKSSIGCLACKEQARMLLSKLSGKYTYSNIGKGVQIWEHRVLVEELLGRALLFSEAVHHINFNKSDNHYENLIVLSSADHVRLHKYLVRILLEKKNNLKKFNQSVRCVTFNWLNYNNINYATLPQLAEGYALEAYKSEFKSLE